MSMKKNNIVLAASVIATSPLVSTFEKNEIKSQSPFSNEKVMYVTNNREDSTVYVDKPMFKKERKKNNRKVKKRKKAKNGKG